MSFSPNYEANDFAQDIINEWELTGVLALWNTFDPTVVGAPTDLVHILAHSQLTARKWTRCVTVRKLSPIEEVVEHQLFDEVKNTFEVRVYHKLQGLDTALWDQAETYSQSMENEVVRILKTVYSPQNNLGTFFSVSRNWRNEDDLESESPFMIKVMEFTLTKLRSRVTTVFVGYQGALAIDVSKSQGNLPGSNYVFTEAFDIDQDEGNELIEYIVPGTDRGVGAPVQFTGIFSGFFQCVIYPKTTDFGTQTQLLNNIGVPLSSTGELPLMYFLATTPDTEATPKVLTNSIPVRITKVAKKLVYREKIVEYRLQGRLNKPSTQSVA